jgi:hypothetical protein
MSTTTWNPQSHLVSPDGKWYWDGVVQQWKAVPASPAPAERSAAPAAANKPERGLSSFAGSVRSEDLAYGQTVLVWARWILIGTGLLLSFWSPHDLLTLQVQLAAIIALAFGNFYLHVQLLRGHPALDNVVYGASLLRRDRRHLGRVPHLADRGLHGARRRRVRDHLPGHRAGR